MRCCAPSIAVGRRLLPIGRVQVCNLNLEVYVFLGVVIVQLDIVCSNYKVQVANLNPQRATVGRPFRVAIPSACPDSCKAKALPYVLNR